MNAIGEALGAICAMVLPVPERLYYGNPDSRVAVCTLSSMDLLERVGRSRMMGHVRVAGRLLSENKGIDSIIRYVGAGDIGAMIVCGMEVRGHMAGHSLFALYGNGAGADGRIIGSKSPDPYIESSPRLVENFRGITLVDMTGETRLDRIAGVSSRLSASCS